MSDHDAKPNKPKEPHQAEQPDDAEDETEQPQRPDAFDRTATQRIRVSSNPSGDEIVEGLPQLPAPSNLPEVRKQRLPNRLRLVMPDKKVRVFDSFSPHLLVGRRTANNKADIDIDLSNFDEGVNGVSRVHAMLAPDANGLVVKDLKSTNGTFLNGRQLKPNQSYVLHSGDYIKFGNLKLQVYFEFGDDNAQSGTKVLP